MFSDKRCNSNIDLCMFNNTSKKCENIYCPTFTTKQTCINDAEGCKWGVPSPPPSSSG